MKKYFFLLFSLFLIQITEAQKTTAYQDTIPFRNDLGLIIIPITFNGVEKQFAFDTGAQLSLAYDWAKKDLKKTNRTITITSSSNLKSSMSFYKSGVIKLGSRKIKKHRILNAPKNSIFSCHRVDGILGVDIIKQFNWTIDYKNKILIMYPSNYFPKKIDTMHQLDFVYSKNRPYVFLTSKKNRFRFLLDTGASGSSNISQRNYKLTGLDAYAQTSFYSGNFDVNGILISTQPKIFQIPETSSGKATLSPIIYYDKLKSTKIGNRLWKEQQLFLSLKSAQLYVSSSVIKEKFEAYPCSAAYVKGKMRIIRIEVGSVLWREGVRQGDEILTYNGQKFTDFCSLDKYQRNLFNSGKSFELQLVNGKKITVSKSSSLSLTK